MKNAPKRIVTLTTADIFEDNGKYYLRAAFIPKALSAAFELQRDHNGITVDGEFFPYATTTYQTQSQVQKWMTYVDIATIAFSKMLAKIGYDVIIDNDRRIVYEGELVGALIKQIKSDKLKGSVDEFKIPGFVLKKRKLEEE